jgi:phosphoadenosine phosphosulfate reductase
MADSQPTLFEPSESDLVRQAMRQPLQQKIDNAIGLLRLYENQALQLSPDGYWLAYSGGKDSDVILELAKMAGVQYRSGYNVTTIDPPELARYIKREHKEVEFNRPEKAMVTTLVEHPSCKGPPTRLVRWCCEKYKEQGGNGFVKIVGVRAAESARRAKMWTSAVPNRNGGLIVCPIIYWTDKDVWAFHKLRSIPHCELYDEGFKRLGCIGCPLAGPKQQRAEFDRWPNYEKAWRRAFDRFWAKWHGVPTLKGKDRWFEDFSSPEEMWQWWISGKARKGKRQCQMDFMYL